jgi:hypothetical protein
MFVLATVQGRSLTPPHPTSPRHAYTLLVDITSLEPAPYGQLGSRLCFVAFGHMNFKVQICTESPLAAPAASKDST